MRRIPIICLVVLLVATGCSTLKDQFNKIFGIDDSVGAQELAWEGMDAYESGKYDKAIEKFQKLKDYYPFSKYAILAELKIADAHYQREEYEEAAFAYENFEQLHPRNEAIPYVIYQIGRCYYDQIDTPDRDQTSAQKALEAFQRLVKQFPGDQYSTRAAEHIKTAQKSLAGHAYVVGIFYYKTKHYKAALNRFMSIISDYPDVGYHQKALEYIARCEASIAREESE
ncbi:MAG: outer membrane protein assembly factor BamD [Desulfobacterales bacterium]|jgi:outer membrane protein assembly factor BamD|nr:outer membrane protein assembly factor BamD [Desulfobacterales bacterium]